MLLCSIMKIEIVAEYVVNTYSDVKTTVIDQIEEYYSTNYPY